MAVNIAIRNSSAAAVSALVKTAFVPGRIAQRKCFPYSTSSLASSSSGIRLIMDAAWELEQTLGKEERVHHLEVGQPSHLAPSRAVEKAREAVRQKEFQSYIPNDGLQTLKAKVAELSCHEGKRHFLSGRNVVVTPGCVAALFTAFGLVLRNPGEEILVPDPGWPNYQMAVRLLKGNSVPYELHATCGWQPDFDALDDLVTDKTKAIVICSPSNPTGAVYSKCTLQKFADFSSKHGIHIISDEIYQAIYFGSDNQRAPSILDIDDVDPTKLFICNGVSKQFSMTGFRVGWIQCDESHAVDAKHILEAFASCGVGFSQVSAEAALAHEAAQAEFMRQSYHKNRDIAMDILHEHGVSLSGPIPEGAFYALVPIVTPLTSTEYCLRLLRSEKVAVAPGETFFARPESTYCNKFVRISLATDPVTLRKGCELLCKHIVKQL